MLETSSSPVDVGNPTVACHQDGGFDTLSDREEKYGITEVTSSETDENEDSNGKKRNNNQLIEETMASLFSQQDRRIFTDFEAAGLPRKEIIRLAHALHESVIAGRQAVSLGLRVPELGELRFDVRIAGKVVFIHAFVENEQASTALALAISTLKTKLEEHRLILGRLDVTIRGASPPHDSPKVRGKESQTDKKKRKNSMLPSLECLEKEVDISESECER